MPMDPVKIALAVQSGLSPICGSCKKFWQARERNIPGDQCMSKDNCGGPMSGDTFHEYDGPITNFTKWCFVCAEPSKFGIQVRGRARVIGACAEHIKLMGELRPVGTEAELKYGIKSEEGSTSLKQIVGPPKKSLFKAIQEVEDHFAEKEGRDPEGGQ